MKRILFFSVLLLAFSYANAQDYDQGHAGIKVAQEYAYPHSIDFQFGLSCAPFSFYYNDARLYDAASGGEFNFRYTGFFSKHWGMFAAVSYDGGSCEGESFFKKMNSVDSGKFTYDPNWNIYNSSSLALTVGAAFRYDFGQFSLRPRLGLGISSYDADFDSFIKRDAQTSVPFSESYFRDENSTGDYMYYCRPRSDGPDFLAYAGVQLTYTLKRIFYFSIECGLKNHFVSDRFRLYEAKYEKLGINPNNWPEAVVEQRYQDEYFCNRDKASEVADFRSPATILNFNFGIGWNIGWNRNERMMRR